MLQNVIPFFVISERNYILYLLMLAYVSQLSVPHKLTDFWSVNELLIIQLLSDSVWPVCGLFSWKVIGLFVFKNLTKRAARLADKLRQQNYN